MISLASSCSVFSCSSSSFSFSSSPLSAIISSALASMTSSASSSSSFALSDSLAASSRGGSSSSAITAAATGSALLETLFSSSCTFFSSCSATTTSSSSSVFSPSFICIAFVWVPDRACLPEVKSLVVGIKFSFSSSTSSSTLFCPTAPATPPLFEDARASDFSEDLNISANFASSAMPKIASPAIWQAEPSLSISSLVNPHASQIGKCLFDHGL